MTRVFLADSHLDTRLALRLMLLDLDMQVVGEAADWQTAMTGAWSTQPDMLLVDWDLIPTDSSLPALRATCPEDVTLEGKTHPVDTGFLVFNEKTYPNLIAMFALLGVESV